MEFKSSTILKVLSFPHFQKVSSLNLHFNGKFLVKMLLRLMLKLLTELLGLAGKLIIPLFWMKLKDRLMLEAG